MIIVNGKIQPKQRPRMNTKTRRTYTPQQTLDYEKLIQEAYIEQSNKRFEGLLEVDIKFYFKIPKSASKKHVALINSRYCDNHKDLDNCIKSVMDALLKVAYEDDKQVAKIKAEKFWTDKEEYIELEIKEIDFY